MTGDDYRTLKPVSVAESNQITSQRTLLPTSGQQRPPSQRVQNQRRRNERPRPGILSSIFGRNREQNVETINSTDNSQLINLAESVLGRPDVQQALNDIQNTRTSVSQSDTPTTQRQNSTSTSEVTNNLDVPNAVSSILRAAGLLPTGVQDRAANPGSGQPQNTNVRPSAGLPQYTAQGLGIGLQGVGAGPVVPQNTNAQLGTLPPQTAVQGPLFLSQNTAAGSGFSQARNTAAGLGTVIPQETVVKLGTVLSRKSVAGQQNNVPSKASGVRVIFPQNTATGLTPTRLGTLVRQNTAVATLPRSNTRAIGNKANSVNNGSNLTLIKLKNGK